MSDQPVAVVSPPEPPLPAEPACTNCGAPLTGEYCAACGQRHEPHVHSIGHFASEAFESVTHADSRLWSTLWFLMAKPGRLTREFFAGRRASYLPPFRLYLVISLFFFVVARLPGDVPLDDAIPPTAESVEGLNEAAQALETQLGDTPGTAQAVAAIRAQAARQQAQLEGRDQPGTGPAAGAQDGSGHLVHSGACERFQQPDPNAGWTANTMFALCKKLSVTDGRDLLEAIVHNIPRAMFVFLPLLAALMKLLYWRPRRYYVEHLLFLVHNHAFVFLAFGILVLLMRVPVVNEHLGLVETALWTYMFWYIFRAMRVYYEQSRMLTLSKYLAIGFAYMITSGVVLLGTTIYSAATL